MLEKMTLVSTGLTMLGFSLHAAFNAPLVLGVLPALVSLAMSVLGVFKSVSSAIDIGEIEVSCEKQAPDDHDIEFRTF